MCEEININLRYKMLAFNIRVSSWFYFCDRDGSGILGVEEAEVLVISKVRLILVVESSSTRSAVRQLTHICFKSS